MSAPTVDDLRLATEKVQVMLIILAGAVLAVGGAVLLELGAPVPGWMALGGAIYMLVISRAARVDGMCRRVLSFVPGDGINSGPISERDFSDELAAGWEVAD